MNWIKSKLTYRYGFYVAVIATVILCGFLIGVTNDLKGTRYLMATTALKIDDKNLDFMNGWNWALETISYEDTRNAVLAEVCYDHSKDIYHELTPILDSLKTNYPDIVDHLKALNNTD